MKLPLDVPSTMQGKTESISCPATPTLRLEFFGGLAGTAFIAAFLILTTLNAGPLWRDETNSINMAQMPSLKEFWSNLPFESFPPLWLMLLRGWSFLGLAASDIGIRVLGLLVGLSFLGSLWLCTRWTTRSSPVLSLGLLGSLPAFYFTLTSNRAYGLAMCLLLLTFGLIWRVAESPTRLRVAVAGLVSVLFAQCLYYDAIFLCAILAGGAVVAVRRQKWKMLMALIGIGATACASMLIYLPVVHRGSTYLPMSQIGFGFRMLWVKLGEAVSARSSAEAQCAPGPEIWIWIFLLVVGLIIATRLQVGWGKQERPSKRAPGESGDLPLHSDLALFSITALVCGLAGYSCFLFKLRFPTQPWYYACLLCLYAVSLEAILGQIWRTGRSWQLLFTGLLLAMLVWGSGEVWKEAHTRRTNVDTIAAALEKSGSEGDLIVVSGAWEGIAFARYYNGRARWLTVPPISSHKVHRQDLMWARLHEKQPISSLLSGITSTLRGGKTVWIVAAGASVPRVKRSSPRWPRPRLPSESQLEPYMAFWLAKAMAPLVERAEHSEALELPIRWPVSFYEDLRVVRFWGYR